MHPPPGCHTYPITFSSTFLGFYESNQTPWPITEHKPQQQRAESQFPSALLQGPASLAEGKGKEDKSSQTAQLAGSGQVAGPRTGFLLTERGARWTGNAQFSPPGETEEARPWGSSLANAAAQARGAPRWDEPRSRGRAPRSLPQGSCPPRLR